MGIHPGFLIAGGVGVLGLGGYALFKGDDKPKEGADPASKDPAAGTEGVSPTGAASGAAPTSGTPTPAPGAAQAGTEPQGRQVGPYTIIADESGTQIVFETATKQPVGILDEQGNLVPVTIDANGKMSIAPQGATPGGTGEGSTPPDAANTSLMAGTQAGAASNGTLPGTAQAGTEPQGRQVGPYTIIADESGTQIVFETATKQPVGILDEQGNLVPVTVDATGKMSIDPSAQAITTGASNPDVAAGADASQAAIGGARQGAELHGSGMAIGGGGAQSAAEGEQLVRTPFGMISQATMSSIVDEAIADVLGDPAGATTSQPTAGGTANSQVQGGYTVIEDGSGNQVVVDAATQTPVGILDQQGNIIPLDAGMGTRSQTASMSTSLGSTAVAGYPSANSPASVPGS